MAFNFIRQKIPEIILIEPKVFHDERGFFFETYKESEFSEYGISSKFAQDNHSMSGKGVLRGLHYQLEPAGQGKLIRVVSGSIFDVTVDVRKGSRSFGKWLSVELSSKDKNILWVPEGFAHGFLSLENNTEVLYKTTAEYSPELERGIIFNDPALGIEWPIRNPIVSKKDSMHPRLKDADLVMISGSSSLS